MWTLRPFPNSPLLQPEIGSPIAKRMCTHACGVGKTLLIRWQPLCVPRRWFSNEQASALRKFLLDSFDIHSKRRLSVTVESDPAALWSSCVSCLSGIPDSPDGRGICALCGPDGTPRNFVTVVQPNPRFWYQLMCALPSKSSTDGSCTRLSN